MKIIKSFTSMIYGRKSKKCEKAVDCVRERLKHAH